MKVKPRKLEKKSIKRLKELLKEDKLKRRAVLNTSTQYPKK